MTVTPRMLSSWDVACPEKVWRWERAYDGAYGVWLLFIVDDTGIGLGRSLAHLKFFTPDSIKVKVL